MRVTSDLWVAGYLRRVASGGGHAVLARRGAREAGAIHLRITASDGDRLLSPAPMSLDAMDDGMGRLWALRAFGPPAEIDDILLRELRFDEDAWIVDVDDRDGRDWLTDDERAAPLAG